MLSTMSEITYCGLCQWSVVPFIQCRCPVLFAVTSGPFDRLKTFVSFGEVEMLLRTDLLAGICRGGGERTQCVCAQISE